MKNFQNLSLTLLRAVSGFLLLQHALQKLFGLLGRDALPLFSMGGVAGVLEFFGGLALIVGLGTRPVAFLLSGMLAAAYFIVHAGGGFWPIQNGGELAALYSFLFLYLSANGGGDFSIDGWLRNRGESSEAAGG